MKASVIKTVFALLLGTLSLPDPAHASDVSTPSRLPAEAIDSSMPTIARKALAAWHDDDRQRDLGTRLRLQLAAGQYAQAIDSILALRALRDDPPAQPPALLPYEIHARARLLQAEAKLPYAQAWQQVFAERFGALGGTMTIGAPWYMVAFAFLKPEYCVPAIGWPPRNVTPCSFAIGKHAAQMVRFVPPQSSTTGCAPMCGAMRRNHSMVASG